MARQKVPGVKKSRLQQVSDARTSRLENGKRRKLDPNIEPRLNSKPPPNNTEFCHKSDNDDNSELGWYWHDSSDSSDNECSDSSEEEGGEKEWESDEEESITSPSLPSLRPAELSWNRAGEAQLRGVWGKGSSATEERKKRNAREYQRQASQNYNLSDMFAKLREKAARLEQTRLEKRPGDMEVSKETEDIPIPPACSPPLTSQEQRKEIRAKSLVSLEKLLSLVIEQDKKYGYRLSPRSNFFQRHLMVKQFLSIQTRKLLGQTRRQLATSVAASFSRGQTTARNIVRWERSWVTLGEIPAQKEAEMYASWLTDEDVVMDIREFARKQGGSKKIMSLL